MKWGVIGIVLLIIKAGVASKDAIQHTLIWRDVHQGIASGWAQVFLEIEFFNPCELFNNNTVHPDLLESARSQCDELYLKHVMKPMQKLCNSPMSPNDHATLSRRRRAIFTLLTIFVITMVASAAFGVAFHQQNVLKNNVANLEEDLRRTREFAEARAGDINMVKEHLNKLQDQFYNRTKKDDEIHKDIINDINNLKGTMIPTSYAMSTVLGSFYAADQAFRVAERDIKNKRLPITILDYFKANMSCGDYSEEISCNIDTAKFQECSMSPNLDKVNFKFLVPLINSSLLLVEADAFKFLRQTDNLSCFINYHGPKTAVINTVEECIQATDIKKDDIIISPPSPCKQQSHNNKPDPALRWFQMDHCQPKHPNDAEDSVQLKYVNGFIHIYCPYSNLTLNGRTSTPCGDEPIVIAATESFMINDKSYPATQFMLHHHQEKPSLWTRKATSSLQPVLVYNEIDEQMQHLEKNPTKIQHSNYLDFENYSPQESIMLILSLLAMLSIVFAVIFLIRKFLCNCRKSDMKRTQEFGMRQL